MRKQKVKLCKEDKIFYAVGYTIVIILTLLVLYPVIYIVSASFSSGDAVAQGKVWLWPVDFTLDGYKAVFRYRSIWVGYRNTIFYTVAGTLINVSITMICAYPLARQNLKGRSAISFLFTFTMLFSGGMIPKYILMKNLGLTNTIWSMLLPGAMSVYNMIVARTFIQSNIPNEMLEAAKIDGCDDFQFFFRMVLPLSKTVMAVLTLWYAVGHWNSYFSAFLYLSDKNLYPLQIFLKEILVQSQFDSDMITDVATATQQQNLKMLLKYSVIVVSTAPLMCFYPFVQKYFQKGVMVGSVKG
ncbi:MAG: carbohydrate ABC transporter permease [Lachnospiraceae bacterium]|nr:carbohydrate ABC transporter permease [Lachnospiraceae bacterium]